jgi:hypothetical protein
MKGWELIGMHRQLVQQQHVEANIRPKFVSSQYAYVDTSQLWELNLP